MLENINIFAVSGLLITITSALMALVMLLQGRGGLQSLWGIFCISVFLWGLGAFNIGIASESASALWWWKVAYVGVIFIPALFIHFVYVFLEERNDLFVKILYVFSLFYLVANLFTNAFIREVHLMFDQLYYLSPTPLYSSFVIFFILLIVFAHLKLYRAYRHAFGEKRIQIEYFFAASLIGFVGGSFSFYPVYGVDFYPYLNLAVSLYPLIMGYAIFQHQLMNLRIIMTELFVAALWVFIFARILLSAAGSERLANIALLALSIIIGVFLIRSVIKEIRQREHIEKLARDLEAANDRLKELDQLKSEFVSLATHQIRGPLTAMKGYASMMLEGDFGPVPDKLRSPIDTIFQSSDSLTGIVQDFLDVSRIEQGRMKYEFTDFDVSALVAETATELKPSIEGKGLTLALNIEPNITVRADRGKLKQVLENLLDNALKYTGRGSIEVRVKKPEQKKVLIEMKDTGIGIPKETLPHLFRKFSRASDASRANLKGTGLGLYVAKQLIEAQGGKIVAESEGEGKGASFTVELPLKT